MTATCAHSLTFPSPRPAFSESACFLALRGFTLRKKWLQTFNLQEHGVGDFVHVLKPGLRASNHNRVPPSDPMW